MKKNIICAVAMMILLFTACDKEELISPSAFFTTSLENNTVEIDTDFIIYLDKASGEFLTYFKGDKSYNVFAADDYKAKGTQINPGEKELTISGYSDAGLYTFTLVASSAGKWGQTYEQDVYSLDITVVE